MTGERRRRLGVRVRITAFATIIVAAALVAGAFLLTGLLRSRLDDTATTAARLRARDIAGLAASDGLPATLALPGEESAVVQVVSTSGTVIAASQNIDGERPITTLQPAAGHELVSTMAVTAIDPHDPMRLVAITTDTPTGPVTVYATESLERSEETVHAIVAVLAVAIPALLGLVGVLTWWAVGRTLRPVRHITHTLTEITTTDLHRRVPDPTTSDEIGELAATVNTTLQRLDIAVERQRRFVADASHELRGPLAALRADLELSVHHPDRTHWPTVASDTLTDVERLQDLTDDLLTLARLGAEHTSSGRQQVDLAALVADEAAHLTRPDLEVALDLSRRPVFVTGYPNHLRRLVRNLVHNAEQHAATTIDIALDVTGGVVELRVADDGPGIPTGDRARVMQPFVRLDDARTRDTSGTGLGLAIVDEIARVHHGTINLSDSPTGGLLVTVRLAADPATGI